MGVEEDIPTHSRGTSRDLGGNAFYVRGTDLNQTSMTDDQSTPRPIGGRQI